VPETAIFWSAARAGKRTFFNVEYRALVFDAAIEYSLEMRRLFSAGFFMHSRIAGGSFRQAFKPNIAPRGANSMAKPPVDLTPLAAILVSSGLHECHVNGD
jgi:hypothetical protein